ncbi:MAG: hypothetical protein QF682_09035 [Candidatus Thermoplasmatota archaeon]|nr:hypothetical protein [Candidatus Thermoplasmatota archaeon]
MGLRYIGVLANRDPELMMGLRGSLGHRGVKMVDIGSNGAVDLTLLSSYNIELLLPKITTSSINKNLLKDLKKTNLQCLNALEAVDICQSRRRIFQHFGEKLPHLKAPKCFAEISDVHKEIKKGTTIWVRQDAHNIPKEERVIGLLGSLKYLNDILKENSPEELFFQEYLGEKSEVYKAYVIGAKVFCLKVTGPLDGLEPSMKHSTKVIELPADIQKIIREIGEEFQMNVYGVDFFHSGGEIIVIDINDFPSFRGIPNAVEMICEFIRENYF